MKYVAAVFIGDEVEIPLAVFLFLIGQAMEFFRQRAQGFGEQAQGWSHAPRARRSWS